MKIFLLLFLETLTETEQEERARVNTLDSRREEGMLATQGPVQFGLMPPTFTFKLLLFNVLSSFSNHQVGRVLHLQGSIIPI